MIDLISKNNLLHSTLIYSPPGIGKTTLLRSIIKELASGSNAKRVAVIDTRGELGFSLEENNLLVSILSGYPRKNGIEIATRTMNAQIIVCDEIGNDDDASSIIDTQGAGVTLIATCHGKSVSDILSHSGVFNLHKKRIFDYYVGIDRGDNMDFVYTISGCEEANAHL